LLGFFRGACQMELMHIERIVFAIVVYADIFQKTALAWIALRTI